MLIGFLHFQYSFILDFAFCMYVHIGRWNFEFFIIQENVKKYLTLYALCTTRYFSEVQVTERLRFISVTLSFSEHSGGAQCIFFLLFFFLSLLLLDQLFALVLLPLLAHILVSWVANHSQQQNRSIFCFSLCCWHQE